MRKKTRERDLSSKRKEWPTFLWNLFYLFEELSRSQQFRSSRLLDMNSANGDYGSLKSLISIRFQFALQDYYICGQQFKTFLRINFQTAKTCVCSLCLEINIRLNWFDKTPLLKSWTQASRFEHPNVRVRGYTMWCSPDKNFENSYDFFRTDLIKKCAILSDSSFKICKMRAKFDFFSLSVLSVIINWNKGIRKKARSCG